MAKHRPTDKQRRDFIGYASDWLQKLSLRDWRVTFSFEPLKDSRAQVQYRQCDHIATIKLSTDWGAKPTDAQIQQSALHEVLHLLLADLRSHASNRTASDYDMDCAEHAALWRLQHALLGAPD